MKSSGQKSPKSGTSKAFSDTKRITFSEYRIPSNTGYRPLRIVSEMGAGSSSTPKRPTAKEPPRTCQITGKSDDVGGQMRSLIVKRPECLSCLNLLCLCGLFDLRSLSSFGKSLQTTAFFQDKRCALDLPFNMRNIRQETRNPVQIHLAFCAPLRSNAALALAFALAFLFISWCSWVIGPFLDNTFEFINHRIS